jgi:hypothetical protein
MNEPRNELWEKAAAGDIRAIILWEWREYYPHVPTDEVNNLLELVELQQDGTNDVPASGRIPRTLVEHILTTRF